MSLKETETTATQARELAEVKHDSEKKLITIRLTLSNKLGSINVFLKASFILRNC